MDKQILITGGNGYLGSRLAKKYLESSDEPTLLWFRARDRADFKNIGQKLCHQLCNPGRRVRFYWGDLHQESPFEEIDPRGIKTILHTAAMTRFNVDKKTAQKSNIEGTKKIITFAKHCPNLENFVLLSTIYSSGLRSGYIQETPFEANDGFSNYYEWSKWKAESLLLSTEGKLPFQIFRIATVIADDKEGAVSQYNVFHNTLKLLYYGLLSIIPGNRTVPLYFVTGNFVVDSLFAILNRQTGDPADSKESTIYHVCPTIEESLSLEELINLVFEVFGESEEFRKRRILKPLYSDAESFDLLASTIDKFGGSIINQAMASVTPFAKQLFVYKEIRNENFQNGLHEYHFEEINSTIRKTCRFLASTRWGSNATGV